MEEIKKIHTLSKIVGMMKGGKKARMSTLEKNLHQARKEVNEAIKELADTAIEDSTTYLEAIEKLKDFRWKFTGQSAQWVIDSATELVVSRALTSETKKYC